MLRDLGDPIDVHEIDRSGMMTAIRTLRQLARTVLALNAVDLGFAAHETVALQAETAGRERAL